MKQQKENNNQKYSIIALIIVATVVAYMNVFDSGFINFDDPGYVWQNPQVQSGLNAETIKWAFKTNDQGNWHPLTWISLAADYSMFGLSPKGFHAVSFIIHLLSSVLLFWVVQRMTKSLWQSAFVAFVFALHPLHVESVAWISERKDVLSGLFWILTMGAYVLYNESGNKKYYLLAILLFAFGLLAKPMLVTLAFVLLLLDYWPLQRIKMGEQVPSRGKKKNTKTFIQLVTEKLPFFILALISSIVTFIVQGQKKNVVMTEVISMRERVANAIVSYMQYLKMTFFPKGLAIFYPHPVNTFDMVQFVIAIIVLIGVSVLVWRQKDKHKYLFVGWCWFLGTLVPVIGIVQVGMQALADRYMYIPMIGITVMLAWGTTALLNDTAAKRMILKVVFVLVTLAMMAGTYIQVGYWKNSKTLFEHALAVTSENYLAHHLLGTVLEDSGKSNEAIPHFREAIRIMPQYELTYNNLGVALAKQGNLAEAEKLWRHELELDPSAADVYSNLGHMYQEQRKVPEAIQQFETALRLDPNQVSAHYNYGILLANIGKVEEAKYHFAEAIRISPGYLPAIKALKTIGNAKR